MKASCHPTVLPDFTLLHYFIVLTFVKTIPKYGWLQFVLRLVSTWDQEVPFNFNPTMRYSVEHLCVCAYLPSVSLWRHPELLLILKLDCLFSYCWDLGVLYLIWILFLYHTCVLKKFPPSLWHVLLFSWQYLSQRRILMQFNVSSFFSCIVLLVCI